MTYACASIKKSPEKRLTETVAVAEIVVVFIGVVAA
jgi:hypothetical protein